MIDFQHISVLLNTTPLYTPGFLGDAVDKESACQCRKYKRLRFDPWFRKISWSRKWQPNPIVLPEKFNGQSRFVGCSPWDLKELDMTEHTNT